LLQHLAFTPVDVHFHCMEFKEGSVDPVHDTASCCNTNSWDTPHPYPKSCRNKIKPFSCLECL